MITATIIFWGLWAVLTCKSLYHLNRSVKLGEVRDKHLSQMQEAMILLVPGASETTLKFSESMFESARMDFDVVADRIDKQLDLSRSASNISSVPLMIAIALMLINLWSLQS